MANDNDVQYGKGAGLTDEDFESKNVKVRISIMVDEDILDHFRDKAKSEGGKYQTLMNHALRQAVADDKRSEDWKETVEKRLSRLEKKAR